MPNVVLQSGVLASPLGVDPSLCSAQAPGLLTMAPHATIPQLRYQVPLRHLLRYLQLYTGMVMPSTVLGLRLPVLGHG